MESNMLLITENPQVGKPFICTIKLSQLIKAFNDGSLTNYERNRGTREGEVLTINSAPYKSMKENGFHLAGFGCLSIAKFGEENYVFADGHSRFAAVLKYCDGLDLDEKRKMLNSEIAVSFIHAEEHLSTYQKCGLARRQSGSQKILNIDMVPGHTIYRFLKANGMAHTDLPKHLNQALYHVLYATNLLPVGQEITMVEVIRKSQMAEKQKDKLATDDVDRLKSHVVEKVGNALKWYMGLIERSHEYNAKLRTSKEIVTLVQQAGMMQYMILDFMGNKTVTNYSYNDILKMIDSTKFARIKEEASRVARRNEAIRGTLELNDLLRKTVRIVNS